MSLVKFHNEYRVHWKKEIFEVAGYSMHAQVWLLINFRYLLQLVDHANNVYITNFF